MLYIGAIFHEDLLFVHNDKDTQGEALFTEMVCNLMLSLTKLTNICILLFYMQAAKLFRL